MRLLSIAETDVKNKTVIVRVDYNVPLKKEGETWQITDDSRIQQSLPTIKALGQAGAKKIILMSHLGRPDGKENPDFSLQPIAKHLSELLQQDVPLVKDYLNNPQNLSQLTTSIVLLENLRFYPEEETNDATFSQKIAQLAEIYVNDAFSAAHRAHASTEGISHFLPSYAGLGLIEEVNHLSQVIENPKRPFVAIVGGAKISDKVTAIKHLSDLADTVLVGGGVANNFLKADGFNIAKSYIQDVAVDQQKKGTDYVEFANQLLDNTQQEHTLINEVIPLPKIIYPIDVIAATSLDSTDTKIINLLDSSDIDPTLMFLDIGPKTQKLFSLVIQQAATIFWNGPMGVFENDQFATGTRVVAETIAQSRAESILGGGDTLAAIDKLQLKDKYSYVSTAGGASLEFLSGTMLPGIKPLLKQE